MFMGFGCNAAGVSATRVIDSPRERLVAITHQQLLALRRTLADARSWRGRADRLHEQRPVVRDRLLAGAGRSAMG